jgi:predicted ATPase
MEDENRFFVLTGGPGSGKSTLIGELERRGYARSIEAGRGVIRDQLACGGSALPWSNPALFAELMLCWEMRSYHIAKRDSGWVFFDRGVPDVAGYLRLVGIPVPEHIHQAAEKFRYHPRVFIAPPWKEIFLTDAERKQSFEEAVRTYEAMVEVYTAYGYDLIELPRVPVDERVRFILHNVTAAMHRGGIDSPQQRP